MPECEHVVREGDTLWSIAAVTLRTEDAQRIARYWPRIHRANRTLIGRNPNLIFPGQVLRLPAECDP
jgi:nucleoid-associated protein YgaU